MLTNNCVHGLIIIVALYIYIILKIKKDNSNILANNANINNKLLITLPAKTQPSCKPEANSYFLEFSIFYE